MKKLLLIIPFLFIACGNIQVKDDPCMKPEAVDSVICAKLQAVGVSVYDANLIFKLANLELVRQGAYAKEDCLKFLDNVESVLDFATYNDVVAYIIMEASDLETKYGAEVILLMDYFNRFEGVKIPITEFDKGLLREHINQQRQILGMLTKGFDPNLFANMMDDYIEIADANIKQEYKLEFASCTNCHESRWDKLDKQIDNAAKTTDIILGVAK